MNKLAAWLVLVFVMLVGASVCAAQSSQGNVNRDNLNQKIAAAKSTSDHEAIAVFYDNEAAENEKMVALHRASKNIYSKVNNQFHCNKLIKAYQQAVSEDKALAAIHREMAKEAGQQSGQ